MTAIQRSIARARLRLTLQRGLTLTGWALLGACGVAAAVILTERALVLAVPGWTYAVLAGAAVAAAGVAAWLYRPQDAHVAALIDHRLHLKDRVGTALYAQSLENDPLARSVLRDAEQAAASLKMGEAFPIRTTRVWNWVPVAVVGVVLLGVFLPAQFDPFGLRRQQQQAAAVQEEVEAAEEQLAEAKEAIEKLEEPGSELAEADPDDVLKELASLTDRDLSNPEMRQQAAAELSAVQDKLDQAQRAQEQALRTLENRMSRLDPQQRGPADRFADALRRGDFAAAARELQLVQEQVERGDYSEADKQLLQQQLNNLATQLAQAANNAQQAGNQAGQQQIQQQLSQQGLSSQQIQQLQQQGYPPQAVQQALQQQGMSAQQAQQMAQQIQQQQQQAGGQQQGGQQQQQALSQALSQMASSLGQPGQPGQSGQQGQGQQGQQGQGQSGQGGSFNQGSWQAQQQLGQMAQMQQQLQRRALAQQQLQQAMQQLGQGQGQGNSPQNMPGSGGRQAGTARGGNPTAGGVPQNPGPYQTEARGDIREGQGRVIASWQEYGQVAVGEPTVEFDQTVTAAREDAARAVTEDRVPRRYHEAVKGYFNQLPEAVRESQRAPAAPR